MFTALMNQILTARIGQCLYRSGALEWERAMAAVWYAAER